MIPGKLYWLSLCGLNIHLPATIEMYPPYRQGMTMRDLSAARERIPLGEVIMYLGKTQWDSYLVLWRDKIGIIAESDQGFTTVFNLVENK